MNYPHYVWAISCILAILVAIVVHQLGVVIEEEHAETDSPYTKRVVLQDDVIGNSAPKDLTKTYGKCVFIGSPITDKSKTWVHVTSSCHYQAEGDTLIYYRTPNGRWLPSTTRTVKRQRELDPKNYNCIYLDDEGVTLGWGCSPSRAEDTIKVKGPTDDMLIYYD